MFKKRKPSWISQEDWDAVDSPEVTDEQFKNMRPMREVFPDLVAALEEDRKRRGRPAGRTKEAVRMSLDTDLVAIMRASGAGWQTRANAILRKAFKLKAVGR
jgi:uncharacterized protein (DUF4415 family)